MNPSSPSRTSPVILKEPTPISAKRTYASFLTDSVGDPDSLVAGWLECCFTARDSSLCRLDDPDPVQRLRAQSAPAAMASSRAPSRSATGSSTSSTANVRHPSYREDNLRLNNVNVRHPLDQLPDEVLAHAQRMRAKRSSPSLSPDELKAFISRVEELERGCTKADVEALLKDSIFPRHADSVYGDTTGLDTATSALVAAHLVPHNPDNPLRISQPKPDCLYGYTNKTDGAFKASQLLAQVSMDPQNARFAQATSQGLRFPFLAIEFKGTGGTRGNLWVATNQCAGASAACLHAVDRLNVLLRAHERVKTVDNLSYAIAVDNNMAQLYISWKESQVNYSVQRVDTFMLSRPEEFSDFRKQVRNILDWGKDTRLMQIREALDTIVEENRKQATERAKSRSPPSSDGSY
ncbi:hypothetical protein C8A00DRAFT_16797 [Chaetomidium leptoderma]|uniref:DUF7924 domain-containing protein n=1 Tax=Chaetomidium leptoderma TaxID=669021 RepID=A0AAN6VKE5_9PEZI|nr:hypothetical protein C8A00DRAFT_16797 [Chaetomidium leptoderma]